MINLFTSYNKGKKIKINLLKNNKSSNQISVKRIDSFIKERKKNIVNLKMTNKSKMLNFLKKDNIRTKAKLSSFRSNSNSVSSIQNTQQTTITFQSDTKRQKKRNFFIKKNKIISEKISSSFDKIPKIIQSNKKLLNDGIYNNYNEIEYSKRNENFVKNYFDKKNELNERKSIILNKIFENKKRNSLYYPKKNCLIIKDNDYSNDEFHLIKNKFKEYEYNKIRKKSVNFANKFTEIFTENMNKNNHKKSKSPNYSNILYLIKKIKLKNFINTKSLIIDSDLDDIDLKINNTNETYRIHDGFPKKYPKFLKTKFKRDTILKFGSYKGIYFGSPV